MVKVVTYILENNATVQGLVGLRANPDTDVKHKVFPVVMSQDNKAPYIVVRLSSRARAAKNCDWTYGVQVVSYANSYDDVTALNEAVITAIENQARGTVNGETFGFMYCSGESDDYVKEHNLYAKITTFEGMAE